MRALAVESAAGAVSGGGAGDLVSGTLSGRTSTVATSAWCCTVRLSLGNGSRSRTNRDEDYTVSYVAYLMYRIKLLFASNLTRGHVQKITVLNFRLVIFIYVIYLVAV